MRARSNRRAASTLALTVGVLMVLLATTPTLAADAASFEAESMSESSSAINVVSDTDASPAGAGEALKWTGSATATETITTTADGTDIVVRARGPLANGQRADMVIKLDGVKVRTQRMTGDSYADYSAGVTVPAGSHTIAITGGGNVTSSRYFVADVVTIPGGTGGDSDGDGVADTTDNCPNVANPLQKDFDSDGAGNVCDNAVGYSGPKTITSGGTYTGAWKSTDPTTPAVTIATTEEVVVDGCYIAGAGNLFEATVANADVEIKNCYGQELHPGASGLLAGYFFYSDAGIGRGIFELNEIEGTRGILNRDWTGGQNDETYKVRYNRMTDCNGRTSTSTGWSNTIKHNNQARFSGNRDMHDIPDFEIGWNTVANGWGSSSCEDHISFYDSGGSATDDYEVHHNLVDGAYEVSQYSGTGVYSGGGTITDGTGPSDPANADQYITFHHNTVLDSMNYGQKITQGHHNKLLDSISVRDCLSSNGHNYCAEPTLNGGAGVALDNAKGTSYFGDHVVTGNQSGWAPEADFNLQSGDCVSGHPCTVSSNTSVPSTSAREEQARDDFYAAVHAAGVTLGVLE